MGQLAVRLGLLLAMTALASCGNVDVSWKEEVKLADGQVIIVKRTAQGKALGEIGGPGGWRATRMTLEIDRPRLPTNPPEWSQRWVPMLFDYDAQTKEWFLVATFYTCVDWRDLNKPKLPYLQYRVRDGRWEEAPLDSKMIGRKANLLTGVDASNEAGLVSLAVKEQRDRGAYISYREIVDVWQAGC